LELIFHQRHKRFEIVYNLLSLEFNTRLIVKIYAGEGEAVPSMHEVFSAALWYQEKYLICMV
jgi:NADH dehydrogenase (ubiquinone) Fe-S protein 3